MRNWYLHHCYTSMDMQRLAGAVAGIHIFQSFGEALRFFRKRARLTQEELAREVGYSREYIAQLEGGRRKPDPSAVAALFIPALDLTHAPADATRLLELATASRGKLLQDFGIRIHQPARAKTSKAQPVTSPIGQTLSWYIEMDPEAALRLANALEPMWMAHNDYREARAWFSAILARSTSATVTRAEALLHASRFAQRQGDAGEAVRLADEALRIHRRNSDMRGACVALNALGWAMLDHGRELARARACFRECLLVAREIDEPHLAMEALIALIHESMPVTAAPARWDEIEADLNDCERLAQQLGDVSGSAFVWMERGFLEIARGSLAHALQCHLKSQHFLASQQDKQEMGWSEMAIGEVLWFMRDLDSTRAHLKRGLSIFRHSDQSIGIAIALHHLAQVDRGEGLLATAEQHYRESLALSQEQSNANMIARNVAGLAGVALARGDARHATLLMGWARAQFDALLPFLSRYDIDDYRHIVDVTRVALGEVVFAERWSAGQSATLAQVLSG